MLIENFLPFFCWSSRSLHWFHSFLHLSRWHLYGPSSQFYNASAVPHQSGRICWLLVQYDSRVSSSEGLLLKHPIHFPRVFVKHENLHVRWYNRWHVLYIARFGPQTFHRLLRCFIQFCFSYLEVSQYIRTPDPPFSPFLRWNLGYSSPRHLARQLLPPSTRIY